MQEYDYKEIGSHINVGTGRDHTIKELAEIVKVSVGYKGGIEWDSSKPDGMPRKLLDVAKIEKLGWEARVDVKEGVNRAYKWYTREASK